jgi:hypothetical protein
MRRSCCVESDRWSTQGHNTKKNLRVSLSIGDLVNFIACLTGIDGCYTVIRVANK